jgi:hypothetical protein
VINHNAPPTRNAREYLLDALQFYASTAAQLPVGWTPDGKPETWTMQFPKGSRVVFDVPAEDVSSAAAIAGQLQTLRDTLNSAN